MGSNLNEWAFISSAHRWKQAGTYWVALLTFKSRTNPYQMLDSINCIFSIKQYRGTNRPDWCDLPWEKSWSRFCLIHASAQTINIEGHNVSETKQVFRKSLKRLLTQPTRNTVLQWSDDGFHQYVPDHIGHYTLLQKPLPIRTLTKHLDWGAFQNLLKTMEVPLEELPKPFYVEAIQYML
jgi:hypothetical protein